MRSIRRNTPPKNIPYNIVNGNTNTTMNQPTNHSENQYESIDVLRRNNPQWPSPHDSHTFQPVKIYDKPTGPNDVCKGRGDLQGLRGPKPWTPRHDQPQASIDPDLRQGEVSISSARASVMVYDDVNKKWIPSGSSSGLSKVQLYHHQVNNTFRVVGRKLQDHEIVINCAILKGLKYNKATGTFHQWRDNKQVYGLNFSSKDDADAFAGAMFQALDELSNGSNISRSLGPAVVPGTQPQSVYQQGKQTTTQYEEDMGYRTMTREDVAIIQERRMSQQNQVTNSSSTIAPNCIPPGQQQQQQQPQQSGHHRTSSAPPAPQPQQQPSVMQQTIPGAGSVGAVPPPHMPIGVGPAVLGSQAPIAPPAPPCPPPMMNFNTQMPPATITNQYAQSPSSSSTSSCSSASASQLNLSNQSQSQSQSQSIYGTNHGSQYGLVAASNNNQYTTNALASASLSQNQYAPGQQNNIYNSNGQINACHFVAASNSSNSTNSNGGIVNSQYGSNSSINHSSATNPYGIPSNAVNQYAGGGGHYHHHHQQQQQHHAAGPNVYAPVSSVGPPLPAMIAQPLMQPPTGVNSMGVPPAPVSTSAPPPPPPPPVPDSLATSGGSLDAGPDMNSLAGALQAARLKKKQASQPVENSGSSTSSSGSGAGNYGTIGRGAGVGMASMMDEMAKTLARRRAAVEKKQPEQAPEPESSPDKKSWDKNNASSNNKFPTGAESPKSSNKRFGTGSEDTLLKINGVNDGFPFTSQDIEAFKTEIIKEVRKEFQKLKTEMLEALRSELNRR